MALPGFDFVAYPITRGPKHHFFGYYGIPPWDPQAGISCAWKQIFKTTFQQKRIGLSSAWWTLPPRGTNRSPRWMFHRLSSGDHSIDKGDRSERRC